MYMYAHYTYVCVSIFLVIYNPCAILSLAAITHGLAALWILAGVSDFLPKRECIYNYRKLHYATVPMGDAASGPSRYGVPIVSQAGRVHRVVNDIE